jgi:hypothetical protein
MIPAFLERFRDQIEKYKLDTVGILATPNAGWRNSNDQAK